MKNKQSIEVSNNQVVEYLADAAAHGGYSWDGVRIENGTTVTCLKTIAGATGLSYYRVKKMYRPTCGSRPNHYYPPQMFRYNHFLFDSAAS